MYKPIYILSGMSGCGKSTLLECCRWHGAECLKSFNKFLLNMKFGYGVKSSDFLIMNMFMQAYQVSDADWVPQDEENRKTWVIERSVLDGYYFKLYENNYIQSKSEVGEMNHVIKSYFDIITLGYKRKIVLIDIYNYDRDWIERNLSESWTRNMYWSNSDDYLKSQDKYKDFLFGKLCELAIPFSKNTIQIYNINSFTKEVMDKFVTKYIEI